MRRVVACLFALVAGSWALPAAAIADCSKPRTGVERLLCSNDRLAVADEKMALAFRGAFYRVKDKDALIKEQDDWRKNVRDACNDVPCLLDAYQRRTSELETY